MPSYLSKAKVDKCCDGGGETIALEDVIIPSSQISDFEAAVHLIVSNQITTGLVYNVIQSNTALVPDNAYICNSLSKLILTIPTTALLGQRILIYNLSGGFKVQQEAGGQIQVGNIATTYGATGSVESTQVGDFLPLTWSAGLWCEMGMRGILDVV
jgi:hypothetical protein